MTDSLNLAHTCLHEMSNPQRLVEVLPISGFAKYCINVASNA